MLVVGVSIDGDGRTTQPSFNTFTVPAGTVDGDVGLIYVVQTTGANTIPTPPTGWTKHPSSPSTVGTNVRVYLFYRPMQESDAGTTVTTNWSPSGGRTAGVMIVLRDVTLSGFASNVNLDTSSGSTIASADVSTGGSGWSVITFLAARSAITTGFSVTPPAGFTEDAEANTAMTTSPNLVVSASHLTTEGPADTYGGGNFTSTDSVTGISYTIALPPAGTNDPPVVSAGADQTNIEPWSMVTLTGTATDTDGTIPTVGWTQLTGPSVTLLNANTTEASFEIPGTILAQTYTFRFSATDNSGATTPDTVSVTTLPVTERAVMGGIVVPMRIKAPVTQTVYFLATEISDTITTEAGDLLVNL